MDSRKGTGPKVVMAIKVRDEVDAIEQNLRIHHALGVEHFVATNLGSSDGSDAVLRRWEQAGLLTLFEPSGVFLENATKWIQAMTDHAIDELGADWVLHADSDEFIVPVEGSISTALGAIDDEDGAVVIPRTNFVAVPGSEPFIERMVVRERRSTLGPKLAHRGLPGVVMLEWAGHMIATERDLEVQFRSKERAVLKGAEKGSPFSPPPPDLCWSAQVPLRMYHYPARSLEGFRRRLEIEVHDRRDTNRSVGLVEQRLEAGEAEALYSELLASGEQIAAGIEAGRLTRDESVRDVLARAPDPLATPTGAGSVSVPATQHTDRLRAELQADAMLAVGRALLLRTVRHNRAARNLERAKKTNSELRAQLGGYEDAKAEAARNE